MVDFLWIVGAFIAGLVVTTKIRWFCEERGMLAQVGTRSSHKKPVAVGGGLAFPLVMVPLGLALVLGTSLPDKPFMLALLFGGALVAAVGWLDDVKPRPVWLRLAVQSVCVAICLAFLPALFGDFVPLWLEKILLFLAWVWFINLYNFMDGIDGLAAMEAVFLALALSFFLVPFKPLLLVLMGLVLGFLRLNWDPAKVFMGDVGSTFLGFFLGGMMLLGSNETTLFPFLTLTLLFTGDATYTLVRRLLKGKKPWEAHREHWYQRAVQIGQPHTLVVKKAILVNLGLLLFAFLGYMGGGVFCLLAGLVLLAVVAWRIRHCEGGDK